LNNKNENEENKIWIDNLMHSIKNSVNDMPYVRILKKLRQGIDQHNNNSDKRENRLVDSHVINDKDIDKTKQDFVHLLNMSPCTAPLHKAHDNIKEHCKDKDNPSQDFEMNSWIKGDDGQWIPPEEPSLIPKIHACNHTLSDKATTAQSDNGANRIVTDNINLLQDVIKIQPTPMGGINKNEPGAIICHAIGKMPIRTKAGDTILVTAYHSNDADGTIISPTTIVTQLNDQYYGWLQYADVTNTSNLGHIVLLGKNGQENSTFDTFMNNDLWYHDPDSIGPPQSDNAKVSRLSNMAKYELWHQCTGHAGASTLEMLHKHCKGIPKPLKGNAFYRCASCMSGKLSTKRSIGKKKRSKSTNVNNNDTVITDLIDDVYLPNAEPGQHFHMDFGFVRGTEFNYKTETGKTITSIDGKNSYLAIIDRSSRYIWIFLTDSKKPPVQAAKMILQKFKSSSPIRTVRVDQGGELGKSHDFRDMIGKEQFSLELTGSDASAQNGMIENPNRTFGQMMRCLLHSSELGSEYW
jgi:hypothetical protein